MEQGLTPWNVRYRLWYPEQAMSNFTDKSEQLAREIAQLEADTESNPAAVQARIRSLQRSLRWYQTRIRPIEQLGVGVGDTITTSSTAG